MRTVKIKETYDNEDDPWLGILEAPAFAISSTTNRSKGYSTVQLVFIHDMILPIKHEVDWELICPQNQTQTNNDNVCENNKIFHRNYKVEDKVMLDNHTA